jgi:hypothetical protein
MPAERVRVVVRVRPPQTHENALSSVAIDPSQEFVTLANGKATHSYQ